MTEDTFTFQSADGTQLFGRWRRPPSVEAVVVLVHGLGEHSGRYESLIGALEEARFATVAFDSRGHGQSAGPRGHVSDYRWILCDIAAALAEARARLPGAPTFLHGHSMGGAQALYFWSTMRPALAGVVASGPAFRPAFDPPGWKLAVGRALDRVWPSLALSNELDPNEISSDPAVVKAYLDDPLVHDRISVRLFNEWQRSVAHLFQRAQKLAGPILLMHGEEDRLASPQATREFSALAGPVVTLKLWEGMRHEIHHEPGKEDVFRFLIDWLRGQLAKA